MIKAYASDRVATRSGVLYLQGHKIEVETKLFTKIANNAFGIEVVHSSFI
jgi:hypothetical protein